jgi:hypothetical protein
MAGAREWDPERGSVSTRPSSLRATAAVWAALAVGLVSVGALVAQLGGESGAPQLSKRHRQPAAHAKQVPEPTYCATNRLHDAFRMNTDEKSVHFGQCAQICLNPGLRGVAEKHGVRFGSTCFREGCRNKVAEGDKSGQHIYFFGCEPPEPLDEPPHGRHHHERDHHRSEHVDAPSNHTQADADADEPPHGRQHAALPTPEPTPEERHKRGEPEPTPAPPLRPLSLADA